MKCNRIGIFSAVLVLSLLLGSVPAYAEETAVEPAADSAEEVLFGEESKDPADEQQELLFPSESDREIFPAEESESGTEALFLQEEVSAEEVVQEPSTQPEETREQPVQPGVPKLKKCELTASGISVSWSKVKNAKNYEVYLLNTRTGKTTRIATTEATTYEYKKVVSGSTYTFTVAAKTEQLSGAFDTAGITAVYLSPAKVKAKRDGDCAVLSWKKVTGAIGYIVYRRAAGETKWKSIKKLRAVTFRDAGVKEGISYEYLVRAYKTVNGKKWKSAYEDQHLSTFQILAAPVLKKTETVAKGIRVQWERRAGAKTYKVFRKTANEKWTEIGQTTKTRFLDKTAQAGIVYYYTITPYNSRNIRGNYDKTGVPGVQFQAAKAPSVKNAAAGVRISWKKNGAADGYRVYRKAVSAKAWKKLATVTGKTAFTDTKVKSGKKYKYLVLPYKLIGNDKYFSYYSGKSEAAIRRLTEPSLRGISSIQRGVKVTWGKVAGAKGYAVYRREGRSGAWALIGKTKQLSFVDETAKADTIYSYAVTAYAGKVESAYGSKTLRGMHLLKPVLHPLENTNGGLKISWDPVEGASGYYIYTVLSSGKLKYLKKTSATSFTDTGVKDGVTYTYTVRAYNTNCKDCLSSYKEKGRTASYIDPLRASIRKLLNQSGWDLQEAFHLARKIPFIDKQPNRNNTRDYARWTLDNGKGDCYGKAAVFVLMARELGYECYLVKGWTPFANGGGTEHGWVDIKVDGVWYVCDLSFNNGGVNSAYMIHYGQKGTLRYSDYRRMP